MNADEYLEALRQNLKNYPPEKREELLNEIASHIESGGEDPGQGKERRERDQRVMAEMGSPEQMEVGLRRVHRPNCWVDLLLVLFPYYILQPSIQVLLNLILGPMNHWDPADPHLYLGGRMAFLLAVLFALVGRQRRSAALFVFWITSAVGTLVSLMFREGRLVPGQETIANSTVESILLYLVLAGIIFWLMQTLRMNQFDLLLVVFALLPLMHMAANVQTGQIIRSLPQRPFSPPFGIDIMMIQPVWSAGMALFFLLQRRDTRWFGLLLVVGTYVYPYLEVYPGSPVMMAIWSSLLAVVLSSWGIDLLNRRRDHRMVE